ncbi:hypothetical protein [Vibrio phage VpV262]|uniref:Uncharacterized protein n=1 Tax=Vibrio phage VpV262 TaxID=2907796 RepID=Q8LT92_9CAUD|nr:hypothetical protein VpV262p07 [Vibrio phage VpV262]AAM28355.1 hypothetical protein [Vibrio phage VpV262]
MSSAWSFKDPDDLELETPDGDCVYVCGSGERIMYGAGKGEADNLVYYVNVGDYQRAIDVLRKYKDSSVTGWGHQLLADLENYMLKSTPDPVASIDEADSFGIGQPNRKSTKQWEPDTPDPDVDLMKSIRDACHR